MTTRATIAGGITPPPAPSGDAGGGDARRVDPAGRGDRAAVGRPAPRRVRCASRPASAPLAVAASVPAGASTVADLGVPPDSRDQADVVKAPAEAEQRHIATVYRKAPKAKRYVFRLTDKPFRHLKPGRYLVQVRVGASRDGPRAGGEPRDHDQEGEVRTPPDRTPGPRRRTVRRRGSLWVTRSDAVASPAAATQHQGCGREAVAPPAAASPCPGQSRARVCRQPRNAAMTSAKRATDVGAARVGQADDRRLHAGLGQLAVAADVLLDRRRALALARLAGRDHARGREVRHLDRRPDRGPRRRSARGAPRPCGGPSSGSPNRLHASACRATRRSVRRSPEPPTRIGTCSCSGRG